MALSRVENVGIRFTEHTIRRMHELIDRAVIDPKFQKLVYDLVNGQMRGEWKNYLGELDKVFRWYKSRVDYRRDPQGVELLQDVWATLDRRRGDCDDAVIWLGAAARILGFPIRFVTVSQYTDKTPNHIYFQVQHKGKWIGVDATQHGQPLGWEPNVITDKKIWSRHEVGLSGLGDVTMSNGGTELDHWFGESGKNGTVGRPSKEAFYSDIPDLPDSLEGMDDQVQFSGLGMVPSGGDVAAQAQRIRGFYDEAGSSTSRNIAQDLARMTPSQRASVEATARSQAMQARDRKARAAIVHPQLDPRFWGQRITTDWGRVDRPVDRRWMTARRWNTAGISMPGGRRIGFMGEDSGMIQYPGLTGQMGELGLGAGTATSITNVIAMVYADYAAGKVTNLASAVNTAVAAYRANEAQKDAIALAQATDKAKAQAEIDARRAAAVAELNADIASRRAGGMPGWVLPVAGGALFLAFVAMQWRKR